MGHMTSTVMFVMLFAATAQCKSAIISSSSCILSSTNKADWEFGSSDLTVAVFICRSCFQFSSPFNISTCWPVNLVQNKTKSRVIFILSTLGFMAQGSHNLTSGTLFLLASFTICILCAPAHLRRPCQEQCRRYIHSRAQLTPMMRLSLKKTNSDDGHRCWQHCSALAAMDNELASICNDCLARSARGNLC